MAGEVPVAVAHAAQVRVQQGEMLGFLVGHAQPVAVEGLGHAVVAPGGIEREVDRIELDMADRMDQRGPAFVGEGRALWHGGRRHTFRASRSSGNACVVGHAAQVVRRDGFHGGQRRGGARSGHFFFRILDAQRGEGAQAVMHPYNSSFDPVWRP